MGIPNDSPIRRSRWTLARRLSALFVGLLAVIVVAFTVSAYRGVREQAELRASERMASVVRELAASGARGTAARTAVLVDMARDTVIQQALTVETSQALDDEPTRQVPGVRPSMRVTAASTPPVAAATLAARFASRRRPTDSTHLGWQLWDRAGARRFGEQLTGRDSVVLAAAVASALQTDSTILSPLYFAGSQLRTWIVVPVRRAGRTVGVLVEQRWIRGGAQTEGVIARLSGQDARVFYHSRGSSEWATVRGSPAASPVGSVSLDEVPDSGVVRMVPTASATLAVAVAPIAGTPWRIVLTRSEASMLERPREILAQLLVIGTLLLLAGAAGAWWLSNLETRPLGALRKAADAMAAGDYHHRVAPTGAEDTAALAEAFNAMSTRISGAHATLAEQNATLTRANEAKARFLAVMSHELRTPLNAIGGYAELVALGVHGPTTPGQQDAMERIGRSKDQLVHLVTDILHYARLEATPLIVAAEPVSVRHVFEAVQENVAEQFARKGIALVVVPSDATVCADPIRVQQVLTNLVSNALQFTEPGGQVTVSAEVIGARTTLRVRDTGVGIAPDQKATIFEPFVQGDSSLTRRAGGAGLGLAIVRQLVTAMDGEVRVDSVLGHGSTFSVVLPTVASKPGTIVASSDIATDTPVPRGASEVVTGS